MAASDKTITRLVCVERAGVSSTRSRVLPEGVEHLVEAKPQASRRVPHCRAEPSCADARGGPASARDPRRGIEAGSAEACGGAPRVLAPMSASRYDASIGAGGGGDGAR
jgi:hypothetical protein